MRDVIHSVEVSARRQAGGNAPSQRMLLLCTSAMLFTSGCLFQKAKPVAYRPPPPRPAAKIGPAPVLPAPPELTATIVLPSEYLWVIPELPEPPKPPKPKPPVVAGPKITPPLPDQPATPKLGQLFTAEEIREYNKELDERLARVRNVLTTIGNKRLNAEDGITMERIRTFQKQAEQARQEDLVTAVNLARRADLLAQDLLTHRLP
jgi:hypothetical protein